MGCAESVVVEDRVNSQENRRENPKVASMSQPTGPESIKHPDLPKDQIDRNPPQDAGIRQFGPSSKPPEKLSTTETGHKVAIITKSDIYIPTTLDHGHADRDLTHVGRDHQQVHVRVETNNTESALPGQSEPAASHATLVQEMNPLHPRVAEVEQRIGPFKYEQFATPEVSGLVTLGPYRYKNGATYTGQFKDGLRHGRGRQTWKNGSVYEGLWESGKFCGKGRIIFHNGNIYTGDFKRGKLEGSGEYAHYDGTTYVGEWKADKQNGKGEEKWSDGSAYIGDYKDDFKEGQGVLKKSDGTRYEGRFEQNNFVEGSCTWPDGRKYRGAMRFEKMEGQGQLTLPTRDLYTGSFSENLYHGVGEMLFKDGTKYKGHWANGKQHGDGIFTNEKGIERKGIWKEGNRIEWTDDQNGNQKNKPKK